MKVTILYDNYSDNPFLQADWGFSCLVEAEKKRILFDTGANGKILLNNMKQLEIDVQTVDEIFISHSHWDHTGGLSSVLALNPTRVCIPQSCLEPAGAKEVIRVKRKVEIHRNVFSTGELSGIEQSLVVKTEKGAVVIVGCSHPGVGNILEAASEFGDVYGIIGGLHGFSDFHLIEGLKLVCPTHCTANISSIKAFYPSLYVKGGVGTVIEI